MISKEKRNKILERYTNKDDKIFAASIIDLAQKFETSNHIVHTSFLNIYEKGIAMSILNALDTNFTLFIPSQDAERCIIFILPSYIEDINFDEYICCLKISPPSSANLKHKDYMGAIYNAGTSEKMIGDIYVQNGIGYVFMSKSLESYYLNNLLYIGKNEVKIESISTNLDEVKSLHFDYLKCEITIPSLRIDVILSNVYNLSRNEVKSKIEDGDLMINSKEMYFIAYTISENDIVSFKKCGKFKIGSVIRKTRSGNTVLKILKYI